MLEKHLQPVSDARGLRRVILAVLRREQQRLDLRRGQRSMGVDGLDDLPVTRSQSKRGQVTLLDPPSRRQPWHVFGWVFFCQGSAVHSLDPV